MRFWPNLIRLQNNYELQKDFFSFLALCELSLQLQPLKLNIVVDRARRTVKPSGLDSYTQLPKLQNCPLS